MSFGYHNVPNPFLLRRCSSSRSQCLTSLSLALGINRTCKNYGVGTLPKRRREARSFCYYTHWAGWLLQLYVSPAYLPPRGVWNLAAKILGYVSEHFSLLPSESPFAWPKSFFIYTLSPARLNPGLMTDIVLMRTAVTTASPAIFSLLLLIPFIISCVD